MLESILSMGGTNTHDLLNKTVNLQPHNDADYMRFQTEMSSADDMKVDNAILEVKDNNQMQVTNDNNQPNAVLNAFMDLDSSYHNVIKGMDQLPDFREKLEAYNIGGGDNTIRTNVDSLGAEGTPMEKTQNLLDKQSAMQSAAMDHNTDMSRWQISTEMFMTKVKVLTSVVSQASQGFKTLFHSSG